MRSRTPTDLKENPMLQKINTTTEEAREAPVVQNFRDIGHALLWMGDALDQSFNGEKLDEGSPLGPAAILRVLGAETLRLDEHLDNGGKQS